MSSLPTTLLSSSQSSSAVGLRDAFASYRRSQYLVAGSSIVSTTDAGESDLLHNHDNEPGLEDRGNRPSMYDHSMPDELMWDDLDSDFSINPQNLGLSTSSQNAMSTRTILSPSLTGASRTRERTPLLRKAVSFHDSTRPSPLYNFQNTDHRIGIGLPSDTMSRQQSGQPCVMLSSGPAKNIYGGKSTFGQTLFNAIAILLGIGMLSEPLAFAYAGWISGTLLIVSYGFISCYTAKILARIMLADPCLRSYADIGLKAFGPRSTMLTSILFCLELTAVSVVLVTLYADSLHTVAPVYSANSYKLFGLVVLIPTVFLPLSLLSYTSLLGILSTLLIIVVIFIDGFSIQQGPGSLWDPADTAWGFDGATRLGIAFGLFIAGFSGHAVIPSLARDMVDPEEFDKMINLAFAIATLVYTMIGYAGYLMFGQYVSDEISIDLLNTPGYNTLLNRAMLWLLVISPLTKFALTTRPINVVLENMLGLEPHPLQYNTGSSLETSSRWSICDPRQILIVTERVLFTLTSVGISILIPEFGSMMAFLGSFSAFIICVIGPISAKMALTGRYGIFDSIVLVSAIIMAVWGTAAAFWKT